MYTVRTKEVNFDDVFFCDTFPVEDLKLQKDVRKTVTVLFGRLEKDHGEVLVRRTLGYLTAARNGVTHMEMQDLVRNSRKSHSFIHTFIHSR